MTRPPSRFLLALPLLLLPAALSAQAADEAFFKGDPQAVMLACAERAQALKPDKPRVLAQVGRIRLGAGDRAKAEACFRSILPGDSETTRWVGQGWLEVGETAKGTEILIRMPRQGFGAKNELRAAAVLLLEAGKLPESEDLMGRIGAVDGQDWEDFTAYARACLRAGHRDMAAAWFARAVNGRRGNGEVWAQVAVDLATGGVER